MPPDARSTASNVGSSPGSPNEPAASVEASSAASTSRLVARAERAVRHGYGVKWFVEDGKQVFVRASDLGRDVLALDQHIDRLERLLIGPVPPPPDLLVHEISRRPRV